VTSWSPWSAEHAARGYAVRVASAAVAEEGVRCGTIWPHDAGWEPMRLSASLRTNLVKRHEAAADDAVEHVLLQTKFFDFGFGI